MHPTSRARAAAILAERRRYFEDEEMLERTDHPPPERSARFAHPSSWGETEAALPSQEEVARFLTEWESGARGSRPRTARRRKAAQT